MALLTLLITAAFLSPTSCCCSPSVAPAAPAPATYGDEVFDYTGLLGPINWANLKPTWKACKVGKQQSPINIKLSKTRPCVDESEELLISYRRHKAVLEIRHHDVAVFWKDNGGSLEVNGTMYKLKHLHLHHPSEHAINGRRYPMEKHMVHESLDGKIAVVSVLYRYGKKDNFLDQFTSKLHWMVQNNHTQLDVGFVEVDHHKLGKHYFRYKGSLTTPPCTEDVKWTVMTEEWTVTRKQVQTLMEAATENNARPMQKLNGRIICYY